MALDMQTVIKEWFGNQWLYIASAIAVILMHILVVMNLAKLYSVWQISVRLQAECGTSPMEKETARYNLYKYLTSASVRAGGPIIITLWCLIAVATVIPMLVLFGGMFRFIYNDMIIQGLQRLDEKPLLADLEVPNTVWVLGIWGIVSTITFAMFMKSLAPRKKTNKLYNLIFEKTGYRDQLEKVKELLRRYKNECDQAATGIDEEAENARGLCASRKRILDNIAQNVTDAEQMESYEAAQTHVTDLFNSGKYDDLIAYIHFSSTAHRNLRTGLTDYEALMLLLNRVEGAKEEIQDGKVVNEDSVAESTIEADDLPFQHAIDTLSSLVFADPSPKLGPLFRKWKITLYIVIAFMIFPIFHSIYLGKGPIIILLFAIASVFVTILAGFMMQYA